MVSVFLTFSVSFVFLSSTIFLNSNAELKKRHAELKSK